MGRWDHFFSIIIKSLFWYLFTCVQIVYIFIFVAGLGGVRYVPEGWEELLTDQAKEELNSLNMSLVDSLRATDAAFSLGEGTDGLVCVRYTKNLLLNIICIHMLKLYT